MSGDITWLDLRLRRRLTIGYAVGFGAYAFIIVALYPAFKDKTGLDELTENASAVAALFGATGPLTTPPGWLGANLYANFLPLIVLMATIGYGASCIAGQDEDGSLALITTLPLRRHTITANKVAALFLQALPVPIVAGLCVLIGPRFDLSIDTGALLGTTVGICLLGTVFGTLALLVGAVTGSRGTALGITSAAAATAYLVNSLAPLIDWLRPARYASPFFYAVGDHQLEHGEPLAWIGVLAGTTVLFAFAAALAFNRLDVH